MNETNLHTLSELDTLVRYGDTFEVADQSDIPKQTPSFNYKELFQKLIKENSSLFQQGQSISCANVPFQKLNVAELLDQMFPARYWEENKVYYGQRINVQEPEREELKELEEELGKKLKMKQARKTGICPVREDLHNQLFDEIIRQCTINCPERGILLMRVRDQLKMTLAAYQTLYQGSIIFGIKKQLEAEDGREEMENKIKELKERKIYLQNRKMELQNNLDSLEYSYKEIQKMSDKKKEDELSFLQQQSKHLEMFLKSVQKAP